LGSSLNSMFTRVSDTLGSAVSPYGFTRARRFGAAPTLRYAPASTEP
jgi:hypothetical protein